MKQSQSTSTLHQFLDNFTRADTQMENFSPNLSASFYYQAKIYFDLDRFDEALVQVLQAIKLNSQFCDAYYLKGEIHRRLEQKDLALESYQMCVKLKTKQFYIYYNIGLLLSEFKKKEEALKYFDISLSFKVSYEALVNRGILLLELNQLEDCLITCDQAIELQPHVHIAYFIKGFTLFKLNKLQEAIQFYELALKQNQFLINALNNQAVVYMKLGNENKAFDVLLQAKKIQPEDEIVKFNLFKLYRFQNQLEQSDILKTQLLQSQNKKIKQEIYNITKIEEVIQEAKLELEFINLRDKSYQKKLDEYEGQLQQEYKMLWNYDLEFDQKSQLVNTQQMEQINQLVQESLQSDECLIRQQLSMLQNRIYFQSLYWRLLNYIKICQKMTSELKILPSSLEKHIKNTNSQNQSLIPQEYDIQLFGKKDRLGKNKFSKIGNNSATRIRLPQLSSYNNSPINSSRYSNKNLNVHSNSSTNMYKKTVKTHATRSISVFDQNYQKMDTKTEDNQKQQEYIEFQPILINKEVVEIMNKCLGISSFKDQYLGNILKVISNKVKIEQQLELEIQYAVCNLAKGGRTLNKLSYLKEFIFQIQKLEGTINRQSYIQNSEWIKGIEDSIIILNYLKDQAKSLIEPQSPSLRIIIQGGQSQNQKLSKVLNQNSKEVDRVNSSCACKIF